MRCYFSNSECSFWLTCLILCSKALRVYSSIWAELDPHFVNSWSQHSWPLLATVSPQAFRLWACSGEHFDVIRNAVLFFFDIHILQKAAKGCFTGQLVRNLSSQLSFFKFLSVKYYSSKWCPEIHERGSTQTFSINVKKCPLTLGLS